jgi:hypothetical protein
VLFFHGQLLAGAGLLQPRQDLPPDVRQVRLGLFVGQTFGQLPGCFILDGHFHAAPFS